jgi:mono/diheme cytochrome c family protein
VRERPFLATRPLVCRALVVLSSLLSACQKSPEDLREWTPKDHTNQSNQAAAANRQVAANPAPQDAPPPGLDAVTLAAWGANCALCHGKVGRGDGPQGPMVKAPDLSNPEWQLQVSDSQIRQTITTGKKSMPAFAHLPATTLDGLTLLVRWFNRDQAALKQRMNPTASAPQSSQAATGSASGPAAAAPPVPPTGANPQAKPPAKSSASTQP